MCETHAILKTDEILASPDIQDTPELFIYMYSYIHVSKYIFIYTYIHTSIHLILISIDETHEILATPEIF